MLTNLLLNFSAIGLFQGVFLALLLFIGASHITQRILGIWCLCLGLNFLFPFFLAYPPANWVSALTGWIIFTPALYGTLCYWYCQFNLCKKKFKASQLWHLSLFFIIILLETPYLTMPINEQLNLQQQFAQNPQAVEIILQQFSLAYWPHQLASLLLFSQAYVYLALSAQLILGQQRQIIDQRADYHPYLFVWLWGFISLVTGIWLCKSIAFLFSHLSILSIVADFFIIGLIYIISLLSWKYPHLLRLKSSTSYQTTTNTKNTNTLPTEPKATKKSQSTSLLNNSTHSIIAQQLIHEMQTKQYFTDPDISLAKLAQNLKISPHQLSETLNQHLQQNFYHFINQWRVKFVINSLQDKPNQTLLTLAYSAGFNSKSTFNSVFKKYQGCSPSAYRNQFKSTKDKA